jgi:hypothetical protein
VPAITVTPASTAQAELAATAVIARRDLIDIPFCWVE